MIQIRDAVHADLPALLAIYNDAVLNTTAIYDETLRTLEGEERWFAAKREQDLPVLVAVAADGTVTGFASYGPFRPFPGFRETVENSVYVDPAHRGLGVGRALLGPLIERARARGLHAMVAGIDADNAVSLRLHAAFGFTKVAHMPEVGIKFGRRLDLVFMQRLLQAG